MHISKAFKLMRTARRSVAQLGHGSSRLCRLGAPVAQDPSANILAAWQGCFWGRQFAEPMTAATAPFMVRTIHYFLKIVSVEIGIVSISGSTSINARDTYIDIYIYICI